MATQLSHITGIIAAALMMSCAYIAEAQDQNVGAVADSIVYRASAAIDSTLYGKNILEIMPSRSRGGKADVRINSSPAISSALARHLAANPERKISGYRVRIFFDNGQNARNASMQTLEKFRKSHPEVSAYRSFQNPYFKVTAGDFRTRSEALELLESIRSEYPSAFILRENINYPAVDKEHAFVADTIKVFRKEE